MATTIYLRNNDASLHTKKHETTEGIDLYGSSGHFLQRQLSTTRGSGVSYYDLEASSSSTYSYEASYTGHPAFWMSEPISSSITISGTITFNFWAFELNMTDNIQLEAAVYRYVPSTETWTEIARSSKGTEVALSSAVNNWTATPTSTSFSRGDRIIVKVFSKAIGTMGSGGGYLAIDSANADQDGDSYVSFTENISFQTTSEPSGTVIYLTANNSSIDPGGATYDSKEAWTTASSSNSSGTINSLSVSNTTYEQYRVSVSGNYIEWYTPLLDAFTLSDPIKASLIAVESSASADQTIRAEIAVVDSDGTNASVWAVGGIAEEIPTTSTTSTLWLMGNTVSVPSGKRLRFRIFSGVARPTIPQSGYTTTLYYGGTAGGSYDSNFKFPVTLSSSSSTKTSSVDSITKKTLTKSSSVDGLILKKQNKSSNVEASILKQQSISSSIDIRLAPILEFSTEQKAHGSVSMHVAGDGPQYVEWGSLGKTALYSRIYVYLNSTPGANVDILRYMDSSTPTAGVGINTSRNIYIRDSSGVLATSTFTASVAQWIRIELYATTSGTITARIYGTKDSTTINETLNNGAASLGSSISSLRYGIINTTNSRVNLFIDDIGVDSEDWIGPEGGGANTVTISHNVDALAMKTYTKSHSLDSLIQQTFNKSNSIDALLRKSLAVAHAIDSLILKAQSVNQQVDASIKATLNKTNSLDTLLKKSFIQTHSIDVLLKKSISISNSVDSSTLKTQQSSHQLDVSIRATLSKTQSFDALLNKTLVKTHSVDALIIKTITIASLIDTFIKKTASISHQIDAEKISGATYTKTYFIDSFAKKVESRTYQIDSFIQLTSTKTHSIDSLIKKTITSSHFVESNLRETFAQVTSIDSIIRKTQTSVHSLESLLQVTQLKISSIDALLQKTQVATYSIDSFIEKVQASIQSIDSILRKTQVSTQSVDALLNIVQAKTYTIDSIIISVQIKTYSIDTLILKTNSEVSNVDALLQLTSSNFSWVDVNRKKQQFIVSIFDSFIIKTQTKVSSVDVAKQKTQTQVSSIDSLISKTSVSSHNTDALVSKIFAKNQSIDSLILKTLSVSASIDGLLLKSQSSSHSVDVYLKIIRVSSHSIESLTLKAINSQYFVISDIGSSSQLMYSVESLISKTLSSSSSVESLILKTNQVSHSIDNYMVSRLPVSQNIDAKIVKRKRSSVFEGGTDEVKITSENSGGSSGDAFEVVT